MLSLASPVLAVRGKPVRGAKSPLDSWHTSGSPTPVRRVPFFACPKQGTERKGTPDSTPANPAGPLARRSAQKVRPRPFLASAVLASLESPGLALRDSPVRRDDSSLDCHLCPSHPCAWGERGLAALRSPCSRLQVRGSPSVASPFSGTKVHWTFVLIRFTRAPPLRACTSLSLLPRLE